MEYMPEFRVLHPTSVADAIEARRAVPGARWLAGGTDLIPNIRRGIEAPAALIALDGIDPLRAITVEPAADDAAAGVTRIGAAATLAELIDHSPMATDHAAVVEAARQVAASTHREVATVGGNLCLDTRCVFYNQSEWWRGSNNYCFKHLGEVCHVAPKTVNCFAAYSGDLAPALLVHQARVEIASPEGDRIVPLVDLFADDGRAHLRLQPDELLVAIRLPRLADWHAGYAKVRVRSAIDFPLCGAAAALRVEDGILADLRLALTGTNSMPLLVRDTDRFLGAALDDDALDGLVDLLPKQIQPMNSTMTPPGYRRRVIANITRSLLKRLRAQAFATA